jgi:RNA methyltransferase, TrmH family
LAFNNAKVQRLRRLLGHRRTRADDGAFVVEGRQLVGEVIDAGWEIEAEFVAAGTTPISAGEVFVLAAGVIERVASTESPQPTLAVVRIPSSHLDLATADFVLVVDRIADPGNLGTILRSAEAAGVDGVVLTAGSVDPFNPKVVRASAGALFRVPVLDADVASVRDAGLRIIGTSSHRGSAHTDADLTGRIALVVGNEAHGLPDDLAVDEWVTIRHRGRAESLNVAMAATVLCFEACRQREIG